MSSPGRGKDVIHIITLLNLPFLRRNRLRTSRDVVVSFLHIPTPTVSLFDQVTLRGLFYILFTTPFKIIRRVVKGLEVPLYNAPNYLDDGMHLAEDRRMRNCHFLILQSSVAYAPIMSYAP